MKKAISVLLSILFIFGLFPVAYAENDPADAAKPEILTDLPETYTYTAEEYNEEYSVFNGHTFTIEAAGEELFYEWYISTDNGETWLLTDGCEPSYTPVVANVEFIKNRSFLLKALVYSSEDVFAETSVCRADCVPELSGLPFFVTDLPEILPVPEEELAGETYILNCSVEANAYGEAVYTWEMSEDGGETWTGLEAEGGVLSVSLPTALFGTGKTLVRCTVTDENENSAVSAQMKLCTLSAPALITDLPEKYVYLSAEYDAEFEIFNGHTFTIEAAGEELSYEWYVSTDNGETWTLTESDQPECTPVILRDDFIQNRSFLIKAFVYSFDELFTETTVCRCTSIPEITADLPSEIFVREADKKTDGENEYYEISAQIEAAGSGELSYEWFYTRKDISEPISIEGADSAVLTNARIPADAVNDGCTVYCMVSDADDHSVTSGHAAITTAAPITVTLPKKAVITEKHIINDVFACKLTAAVSEEPEDGLTYEWYIKTDSSDWQKYGENSAELRRDFTVAELLDNVRIKCAVITSDGLYAESNECVFEVAPHFGGISQPEPVKLGGSGTLKIDFRSTDEAKFFWLKSTDKLRWYKLADNDKYSGTTTGELTVNNLTKDDFAVFYRCGTVINDTAIYSKYVNFENPPIEILTQPVNCEASEGKAAVFTVDADGLGITYTWLYLDPEVKLWRDIPAADNFVPHAVHTNKLTVDIISEDAGELTFACLVSDGTNQVLSDTVKVIYKEGAGFPFYEPIKVLRGDTDLNGKVEAADARLALRASVMLEDYEPGSPNFVAADWNQNGTIESGDARSILRRSVGLE